MRWWNGITDSKDMSLSKLQDLIDLSLSKLQDLMDREAWHAAEVAESTE